MNTIKSYQLQAIVTSLVICLSMLFSTQARAGCSVHDHLCSYHAIGQITTPAIEQQLGENSAQGQFSESGLYVISAWQDNASNQSADLDLEVLLPEKALNEDPRDSQFLLPTYSDTGPYVIRSVGYPADGNPFEGIASEAPRHVGTDQYDITFMNNTARAIHSEDANGANIIANEPAVRPCKRTKNCEFVQIKGNIPSGEYRGAVTNYDYHNLSDPSTPYYILGAYLSPDLEETGVIINKSHTNGAMVGTIENPDQVSEQYVFDFYNRGFSHAKSDVAYDDFISSFYHKTKYADPIILSDGYYNYKVQDRYADRQTDAIRNTIDANANISQENMGMVSYESNVYLGRDLISTSITPEYQAYLNALKAEKIAKKEQDSLKDDDSKPRFGKIKSHDARVLVGKQRTDSIQIPKEGEARFIGPMQENRNSTFKDTMVTLANTYTLNGLHLKTGDSSVDEANKKTADTIFKVHSLGILKPNQEPNLGYSYSGNLYSNQDNSLKVVDASVQSYYNDLNDFSLKTEVKTIDVKVANVGDLKLSVEPLNKGLPVFENNEKIISINNSSYNKETKELKFCVVNGVSALCGEMPAKNFVEGTFNGDHNFLLTNEAVKIRDEHLEDSLNKQAEFIEGVIDYSGNIIQNIIE